MSKEKIEKSGDEEYQEKLQLIKETVDNFNKEFKLEGGNRVISTPDQFSIPIIHQDGERVDYIFGAFKSEKQNELKIPLKFDKDEDANWIQISDIIRSLLKYAPEFNSKEPQIIKKCLEKFKKEKNNS